MGSRETFKNLSKIFEEILPTLTKHKMGVVGVLGKFGEVWVANQLVDFNPKIGDMRGRKIRSADLYLSKIDKRIEVKTARPMKDKHTGIYYWGFSFTTGKQITQNKFDFCVLLRLDINGKVKGSFILGIDEIDIGKIEKRESEGQHKYTIHLCENYQNYRKLMKSWDWKESAMDKELLLNQERYRNKWEKIE